MILRLLAAMLISLPALAQDKTDPGPSTVSLRAQADREVANDQVVVTVPAEDALIGEALAAFHARAEIVRQAMKAPAAIEGGVSLVTVTVSGTIELR